MSEKSQRFIKFIPGKAANLLRSQHPFAFLLLGLIAERVKRTDELDNGLEIGDALVGDFDAIGASRKQYRTAIKILVEQGYIIIKKAVKNQKTGAIKRAIKGAIKGTIVNLCNSDIWDVNFLVEGHQKGHQKGHEQECTYKNENKKQNKKKTHKKEKAAAKIFFSHEENLFKNVTSEFLTTMQETFPGVDVIQEMRMMRVWLMNPDNPRRKGEMAFIVNWLKKAIPEPQQILPERCVPTGVFD